MTRKQWMIAGMVSLFIIPIALASLFFLFQPKTQIIQNLYFVDGETQEAILKKVDPFVKFELVIENDLTNLKLEVLDIQNQIMDTKLELNNLDLVVKAPTEGYSEGNYYTMTLPEGVTFKAKDLESVRILHFVVDRPDVVEGTLTQNVVEVASDQVVSYTDSEIVLKSSQGLSIGKVVMFEESNKGFYQASKIESIVQQGDNYKITVSQPALDEIYSDINIHKTFDFMAENMVTEVYEDGVVNFVKKAGFLDFLFQDVKAVEITESFSIDTKIDYQNTTVSFILKSNESVSSTWVDGKIDIKFTISIKLTPEFDIRGFDYIDTQYSAVISTKLELTTEDGKTMDEVSFLKILADGRKLNAKEKVTPVDVDESFTKMYTDFSGEWSDNFDGKNNTLNDNRTCMELRIPIYYTINLVLDFGIDVDFNYMIRTNTKMEYTFKLAGGVSMINGKFDGYMNKPTSTRDGSFEAKGHLNLSLMPFVQINAELAPQNFIGVNLAAGPYAELKGYLNCDHIFDVKSLKDIDGIFNIEVGVQNKVTVVGNINIIIYKKEFSKELSNKKVAIAEWGNNYQVSDVTISDKFYVGTGYLKLNNILVDYVDFFSGEITTSKVDITQTLVEVNNDPAPFSEGTGAFVLAKDNYPSQVTLDLQWLKRIRPTDSWGININYSKEVELIYTPFDVLIEATIAANEISPLNNKYSSIRIGSSYGLIDYEGNIVIQPAYSSAFICSDGAISLGGVMKVNEDGGLYAASCTEKPEEVYYLSSDMKIYSYVLDQLIELPKSYTFVNAQNVTFKKVNPATNTILNDYAIGDITIDGNNQYNVTLDTSFDLDAVSGWYRDLTSVTSYKNNGVWKLFNYDDTIKTQVFDNIEFTDVKLNPLFDEALFSDRGYATVKTDASWKIVSLDNETLYGETNQDLSFAYGKYVWFKQDGKWGLIGLR